MEELLKVYGKLLPVMAFIAVGYFVGKKFNFKSEYISKPLINVLLPALVFSNMLDAEPSKLLVLPVLTFLLALSMNYVAKGVHKKIGSDTDPLLLRSSFSFFNIAFFGIPIVTAMFGKESVSVLICIYLGSALYGDTIGYYQVARTKFDGKKALTEMLSIPFLYVFVAGVICKLAGVETPEAIKPAISVVSFTVSALGMMIVGFQLADVDFRNIRFGYYLKLMTVRTLAAAAIMAVIVLAAHFIFQSLEKDDYTMLALVPLFPIAANVTVFAAFLKADEEQSSILVFLSMLLSVLLVSAAVPILS
ncbi:AEC family transporter [Dyadobacter sandarakinus]|uniref:AEC family transporter n=1 Tax=Dyadobacter sandarakinus TaxID=2747268 RepID=A0ABX7I3N1_9BACT|nr:AEC family transporter [Dyadobacter sandarakinus]QRR00676.1 AEC family transporter [Dyadobacter sandarakinus]